MKKLFLILPLLVLWAPAISEAATRVASPTGSGSTCSDASPCTLNTAVGQMQAGDTLFLKNGIFAQTLTNPLPSGISSSQPTIMEGESTTGAILRPPSGGGNVILLNSNRSNLTFRKFTIDAVNLRRGETTGFRTSERYVIPNLVLEDLEIKNPQGPGIVISSSVTNCLIRRNKLHDSVGALRQSATGLYIRGDGCTIEYNEIYNFPMYGAVLRNDAGVGTGHTFRYNIVRNNSSADDPGQAGVYSGGRNNEIYNNLIINNSKNGVRIDRRRTGQRLYNNTIYGNGGLGVDSAFTIAGNTFEVKNNIVLGNNSGGTQIAAAETVQATNLTTGNAANLFLDHTNGNFCLKSTATDAINQATQISGVAFNGAARDIGACQYNPTTVTPPTTSPSPTTPTNLQPVPK